MTRKKKFKDPLYHIHCADSEYRFLFERSYRSSYVHRVFRDRVKPFADAFLPGLVLEDEAGHLWEPVVRVELIPHKLQLPCTVPEVL